MFDDKAWALCPDYAGHSWALQSSKNGPQAASLVGQANAALVQLNLTTA